MKGKIFLLKAALAAMILLVLAGCGQKAGTAAAPAASDFPGGWQPKGDYSKRLDLEIMALQQPEGYDYTAGDALVKWYSDHFNYNLDVTNLTFDNWDERNRLFIASGEMPDMAVINYNHVDMAGWVEESLLYRFPDNWKERWPVIASAFAITGLGPEMEQVFGGTYFLPRNRFNQNLPGNPEIIRERGTLPNHLTFFYNNRWMEAVGLPVKTMYTVEELLEYARRIKAQDPGHLGDRLVPITGRPEWFQRFFIETNNAHYNSFYKDKDGTYKWGPAADATLAGLKQYWRAYSEKLINPEFYTLKYGDDYNQFNVSGVAGGFYGEGTIYNMYFGPVLGWTQNGVPGDPEADVGYATVLGQDGLYHQEDLINFWQVLAFNPKISQEKFERLMDLLEFNTTPAGYTQVFMGFEGIDWKHGEDGEYINLATTMEEAASNKYGGMLAIPAVPLPDDGSFKTPSIPKFIRDINWQLYKDRVETSTIETFTPTDWKLYAYDSPARRRVAFNLDQEYANIVTNSKSEVDVEKNWKAWLQEKMVLVQPVLDELNTKLR